MVSKPLRRLSKPLKIFVFEFYVRHRYGLVDRREAGVAIANEGFWLTKLIL